MEIGEVLSKRAEEMATYELDKYSSVSFEVRRDMYILAELQRMLYSNGEEEKAKRIEQAYERLMSKLQEL